MFLDHGYDGFELAAWTAVRRCGVLNTWPTRLVVNELGSSVETGASFSTTLPEAHPLRIAYETFLGGPGRARSSWDQLTALYAITGGGPWLEAVAGHTLEYAPSGEHRWRPSSGGPERAYLRQLLPDAELAQEIERLMVMPALQ